MANPKDQIHIVLVRTQFASNLGSAVRVMKNMGFRKLILVRPECEVGIEARSYAMRGAGILDEARFLPDLDSAASELGVLAATTGRFRGARSRLISSLTFAEEVVPDFLPSKLGLVFGSENNGLYREELGLCQWLVEIPTDSDYPVINLAQSVAILTYHLNLSLSRRSGRASPKSADPRQVESLLRRFESLLQTRALGTRLSVDRLMHRMRKIVGRTDLEREDVNMLHGLIKEIARDDPGSSDPNWS